MTNSRISTDKVVKIIFTVLVMRLVCYRALVNQIAETLPTDPPVSAIPGPVDQKGLAADIIEIDESPKAAVIAPIAIIAHDEDMILRNHLWPIIVAVAYGAALRIVTREMSMRIFDLFAVDINLFGPDLDGITGDADHPLDEIFRAVLREDKHHDIAALHFGIFHQVALEKRHAQTVGQFV